MGVNATPNVTVKVMPFQDDLSVVVIAVETAKTAGERITQILQQQVGIIVWKTEMEMTFSPAFEAIGVEYGAKNKK